MKIKINAEVELRKNPFRGLYIAFEGIDGAGKTTQLDNLVQYLEKRKKQFVVTSEPRKAGSEVGILIHKILRGEVKMPPSSLQYLYTAERIANHAEVIDPSLEKGIMVLSHRSVWSNLPYGMMDKGILDFESNDARIIDVAQGLLSLYHQFIVPDITFYLKISAETAMQRLSSRHIEEHEMYEKKEKLEKIARGYDWQVNRYKKLFAIIDGEKNEDKVFEQVRKVVNKNL